MSRGKICKAQTPKAHLRHYWAPKSQISSRQPGALLQQAGLKKNILYLGTMAHVAAVGLSACDFGAV